MLMYAVCIFTSTWQKVTGFFFFSFGKSNSHLKDLAVGPPKCRQQIRFYGVNLLEPEVQFCKPQNQHRPWWTEKGSKGRKESKVCLWKGWTVRWRDPAKKWIIVRQLVAYVHIWPGVSVTAFNILEHIEHCARVRECHFLKNIKKR